MLRHTYDAGGGVSLDLTYVVDPKDGAVVFAGAWVLGADYGPAGPDMLDLLHRLAFYDVKEGTATPFLSVVAQEIMNADRN